MAVSSSQAEEYGPFNGEFAGGVFGLRKSLPASAPVNADASWTMNLWLRPDGELADKTAIAGIGSGRGARGAQRYFANFADGLRFWGDHVDVPLGVPAEPGRWQMLTAVHDRGTLALYYDGREVASKPVEFSDAAREVNLAPPGPWPGSGVFEGRIAQFVVIDRALSSAEVAALGNTRGGLDALSYEKAAPQTWPIQREGGQSGNPKQGVETLPRGKAPASKPVRKARTEGPAFEADRDGALILRGPWKLAEAPKVAEDGERLSRPGVPLAGWLDATVPGTVLTTLVDQGVVPNPYFGLNNLSIPESLNRQGYWYRLEFTPPDAMAGRRLDLLFKGINYTAEVWLNGQRLGGIEGAFIRGVFDVSAIAKPGQANVLAVKVSPPPHPGIPHEQSIAAGPGPNGGAMCLDGPTFFCTEGWDWIPGIRDRDTGIWQDVVLRATGAVTLGDPQVVTRIPEPIGSRADVMVAVELENPGASEQKGMLRGSFEGVAFEQPVTLAPGAAQTVRFTPADFPQLSVANPRLWWPNGYGSPDLYELTLVFEESDGKVSDRKSLAFGMREISMVLSAVTPEQQIERYEFFPAAAGATEVIKNNHDSLVSTHQGWMPTVAEDQVTSPALKISDEQGTAPYLVLKVNGRKIAMRGGNWGMDDAMKRVSRERLEPYFRLQRDANFNMIRNWCGQSTEEAFFELADEYGILIWNDFWITTQGYNQQPAATEPLLANAEDTIKRFRNHPSIALWCGRNEGVPPPALNEALDSLIRKYDGTRYYTPNSREINLSGSGPWSYLEPRNYFTGHKGMTTELGLPSPMTADGIRAMLAPEDLWPPNDVWAYHDWVPSGAMDVKKYMAALDARYGAARDFEDFVRKAQMVNYVAHRAMFEGMNASLWKPTTGRLMWMSHPAWPSMVWQIYGHDYEPNAAFYGVKKACEPVHVQMNLPDRKVLVSNTTARPLENARVTARVLALDGTLVTTQETDVEVPANSTADGFQVDCEVAGTVRFVVLELREANGRLLSENFYWHASEDADYRALDRLPQVNLTAQASMKRTPVKMMVKLEITNPSASVALMAHATLRHARTAERILPAHASDNYVNLLPGQKRTIEFECGVDEHVPLAITLDGWNVSRQVVPLAE